MFNSDIILKVLNHNRLMIIRRPAEDYSIIAEVNRGFTVLVTGY